jgi:tetratricopeptide (TPR) repeat protein
LDIVGTLSKNLDVVVYCLIVLGIFLIAVVFQKKEDEPEGQTQEDTTTTAEAKNRLSVLTGVTFEDSADDLQMAMPKSEPPLPFRPPPPPAPPPGASTSGPAAAREEQAVLTQYTSGDGQGVEEMEKMLAKDPNNLQLLDWLAFMYYSNNQTEKAIETYGRIIRIDPSNASQHYYLANSFYKANRIDEALVHWRKVVELKPDGKLARKADGRIKKVETALGG